MFGLVQDQRDVSQSQAHAFAGPSTLQLNNNERRESLTCDSEKSVATASASASSSPQARQVPQRSESSSTPSQLRSSPSMRTLSSGSSGLPSDKEINTVTDTVFNSDFSNRHIKKRAPGARTSLLLAKKFGGTSDPTAVPGSSGVAETTSAAVDQTPMRTDPVPSASGSARSNGKGPAGPVNLLNEANTEPAAVRYETHSVGASSRARAAGAATEEEVLRRRRVEEAEALLSFGEAAVVKSPDNPREKQPAWHDLRTNGSTSRALTSNPPAGTFNCKADRSMPTSLSGAPWREASPPMLVARPPPATFDGFLPERQPRVKLPSIDAMMRDAPAVGPKLFGPRSSESSSGASPEAAGPPGLQHSPTTLPLTNPRSFEEQQKPSVPLTDPSYAMRVRDPSLEGVHPYHRGAAPQKGVEPSPPPFETSPMSHGVPPYAIPPPPTHPYPGPHVAHPWGSYNPYDVRPHYGNGGMVHVGYASAMPMMYHDVRRDSMMDGLNAAGASNAVRSLQNIPAPLLQPPRPRVSLACQFCRSRKLRCSQGPGPCDHCTRRGRECVFENTRQPKAGQPRPLGSRSSAEQRQPEDRTPPGTSISTPSSSTSEPRMPTTALASSSTARRPSRYHPYDGAVPERPTTS